MGELVRQFLRHSVVGTIAFLIDFVCMVAFVELLHWRVMIATTVAFMISVVVSFWGSMRFVFTSDPERSRRREFFIYMVLSVFGIILNSICMYAGGLILSAEGIDYEQGVYYMVVKVIATM
ncbi:MAG: GtrA family protein, partial [Atopobiaceae bacterium]|nr:GtrA family protein [Atopobiaceae bacterium]